MLLVGFKNLKWRRLVYRAVLKGATSLTTTTNVNNCVGATAKDIFLKPLNSSEG